MNARDLFDGPQSLRVPDERRSLVLSLVAAPLTIALIGRFFSGVTLSGVLLLVIGALVYVTLSRGRLLGSSVRIDESQMPELYAIVAETARRLGVPPPQVFVRDDPFVPITSSGTADPYVLVVSEAYLDHFDSGMMRFLVGREIAHITAGHTRVSSLLTSSGRENAVTSIVFGAWLRNTEYTADRVGLLCSSFDDAMRAIAVTTLHGAARRVDLGAFASQQADIDLERTLRLGEWTSAQPYATKRMTALAGFTQSPLAAAWREWFAAAPAPAPPQETNASIARPALAPRRRRFAAYALDLIVLVSALHVGIHISGATSIEVHDFGTLVDVLQHPSHFFLKNTNVSIDAPVVYLPYAALLVALTGQTLGMIVLDIRMTAVSGRLTNGRALAHYAVLTVTSLFLVDPILALFSRTILADRFSGTRLVPSSAFARRPRSQRALGNAPVA